MKISVLVHHSLIPPKRSYDSKVNRYSEWITEYDVIKTLRSLGHEVEVIGVDNNLSDLSQQLADSRPHYIFNLLEEFDGEAELDKNIASFLELTNIPFSGCNSTGLTLARDKALAKKLLSYHDILTPEFEIHKINFKISESKIDFPQIVKCYNEEASLGISKNSLVKNQKQLEKRVSYIHEKYQTHAISERFIKGREFFVGVYGNKRLTTLPVWELTFSNSSNPEQEIYSEKAKFNERFRKKYGIKTKKALIDKKLEENLQKTAKKVFQILNLSGYARIDFRVDENDNIFVLEANPNPNIAKDDEFALSAKHQGIDYKSLIKKIIRL